MECWKIGGLISSPLGTKLKFQLKTKQIDNLNHVTFCFLSVKEVSLFYWLLFKIDDVVKIENIEPTFQQFLTNYI